jgi:hypothetical protein
MHSGRCYKCVGKTNGFPSLGIKFPLNMAFLFKAGCMDTKVLGECATSIVRVEVPFIVFLP